MLYTILAINVSEVTLDQQPPQTAIGNHNGLEVKLVSATKVNTILVDEYMQAIFRLSVGKQIELFGTNPQKRSHPYLANNRDANQALRYNQGKLRWSLIDWKSMEPMVQVLEYGAKKYTTPEASGEDNWKKPMDKRQILNSAMRHLIAMMNGEENDPESGLPHVGHLMANCMMYSWHTILKNNLHNSTQ